MSQKYKRFWEEVRKFSPAHEKFPAYNEEEQRHIQLLIDTITYTLGSINTGSQRVVHLKEERIEAFLWILKELNDLEPDAENTNAIMRGMKGNAHSVN